MHNLFRIFNILGIDNCLMCCLNEVNGAENHYLLVTVTIQ